MIKANLYTSIHQLNAEIWDSILDSKDLYHKHAFVGIIEDAKVENSNFWYLTIFRFDELIATVCLSAFKISLDLLMGSHKNWVNSIRKIYTDFLKVNILICGLPISLGQKNIKIKYEKYANEILKIVSDQMLAIAKKNSIYHICYKEFFEEDLKPFEYLSSRNYFKANSIPYMEMSVPWRTFDDYLNDLRHSYRRKIKNTLKKINITDKKILFNSNSLGFFLNDFELCPSDQFYKLYLSVMQRANAKLETLNYDFFNLFFKKYKGKIDLIGIKNGSEVLSAGIVLKENDTLHFMLIGLSQYKNEHYDPYFNLLYGIIQFAIAKKCKQIKLGQTAYWGKQQIGGTSKNVFLFYHCRNKIVHFIFKKLNRFIFPKTILTSTHVFKI